MKWFCLTVAVIAAGCASAPKQAAPTTKRWMPSNYMVVMKDGKEYLCDRSAPTGSHLKQRRLCFTAEEQREVERQSQELEQELSRRGNVQDPRSPSPYLKPVTPAGAAPPVIQ